jgi:tetratricopeptide (TPR) repeat protein
VVSLDILNTKKLEKSIKQIIKTGEGYGQEFLPVLKETRNILKKINSKRKVSAEYYFQLAQNCLALEDQTLAQLALQKAIEVQPDHINSLCLMVALFESQGRNSDMLLVLEKLHLLDPQNIDVNLQMSNLYLEQKDYINANQFALLAASSEAANIDALIQVAKTYSLLGEMEYALKFLKIAYYTQPKNLDIYKLSGDIYCLINNYPKALAMYTDGFKIENNNYELLAGIFRCYIDLNYLAEAKDYLLKLLALDRRSAKSYFFMSVYYMILKNNKKQEYYLKLSLKLAPEVPTVMTNLAFLYQSQGRLAEAVKIYQQVLSDNPDFVQASVNLSTIYMTQGKLQQAFQVYSNRTAHQKLRNEQLNWQGEALQGRNVLIRKEQGLGDQIESAWYLPLLQKDKVKVTYQVDKRLINLLQQTYPYFNFVSFDSDYFNSTDLKQYDYQILQRSLGLRYYSMIESAVTKPEIIGFMKADETLIKKWQQRLQAFGNRPTIGICWRSGFLLRNRVAHYISAQSMVNLAKNIDVNWVNLQYDSAEEELGYLKDHLGERFIHFDDIDLKNDQDNLAALIMAVDKVFSAQTSVLSLAGALGKQSLGFIAAKSEESASIYGAKNNPMYPNTHYVWAIAKDAEEEIDKIKASLECFIND